MDWHPKERGKKALNSSWNAAYFTQTSEQQQHDSHHLLSWVELICCVRLCKNQFRSEHGATHNIRACRSHAVALCYAFLFLTCRCTHHFFSLVYSWSFTATGFPFCDWMTVECEHSNGEDYSFCYASLSRCVYDRDLNWPILTVI